jgi:low affinity Fe/Cu permease
MSTNDWFVFSRFAIGVADKVGSSGAFVLALAVIGIWALTGPLFNYSDTWQLWINTGTTIVTFLMVRSRGAASVSADLTATNGVDNGGTP